MFSMVLNTQVGYYSVHVLYELLNFASFLVFNFERSKLVHKIGHSLNFDKKISKWQFHVKPHRFRSFKLNRKSLWCGGYRANSYSIIRVGSPITRLFETRLFNLRSLLSSELICVSIKQFYSIRFRYIRVGREIGHFQFRSYAYLENNL